MRQTFKFQAGPKGRKKKTSNEWLACCIATPVCYFTYVSFGAGVVMLVASMIAYVIAKAWLDKRRRQ